MNDHSTFVASLRAECQAVREFCEILEAERGCLLRSDADELLQLTQLKSSKVDRLAEFADIRVDHLHSLALGPGREGMTEWLASYAGNDAPELSNLWSELIALAAKGRAMNESNGTLISTRWRHNQTALAVLQTAARGYNLYGPDGQPSVATDNRVLGRA